MQDTDGEPPNANAAFCSPAPPKCCLAVIKAPPAVHEAPLYSSVHDTLEKDGAPIYPPNANAAFCSPAPAKLFLAVIKAPPADHVPPPPK